MVAEEPKPVVMNGYLQKPTVGAAAARAIRPIRSNVSSQENMRPGRAAAEKPESATSVANPEPAKAVPVKQETVRPGSKAAAAETVPDSDLPEMVKAQKELEQRMKYLEKEMKRLPNLDGEAPKS